MEIEEMPTPKTIRQRQAGIQNTWSEHERSQRTCSQFRDAQPTPTLAQYKRVILGRRVRALLKRYGWTLQDLSEASDIDLNFLELIEQSKVNLSPSTVALLACTLEVQPEELLN